MEVQMYPNGYSRKQEIMYPLLFADGQVTHMPDNKCDKNRIFQICGKSDGI